MTKLYVFNMTFDKQYKTIIAYEGNLSKNKKLAIAEQFLAMLNDRGVAIGATIEQALQTLQDKAFNWQADKNARLTFEQGFISYNTDSSGGNVEISNAIYIQA